jgi:hypothetical protein
MARERRVDTTLGDFIVALTDAAGHQLHNDKMTYELVAYILTDLINSSEARKLR